MRPGHRSRSSLWDRPLRQWRQLCIQWYQERMMRQLLLKLVERKDRDQVQFCNFKNTCRNKMLISWSRHDTRQIVKENLQSVNYRGGGVITTTEHALYNLALRHIISHKVVAVCTIWDNCTGWGKSIWCENAIRVPYAFSPTCIFHIV